MRVTHERRYRQVEARGRRVWVRVKYGRFAAGAVEHREPTFRRVLGVSVRRNIDGSGWGVGPFEWRCYPRHCAHVTVGPFTVSVGRSLWA